MWRKKIYRISYDFFFYINQRDTLGENENFRLFGIVCVVLVNSYANSCLFWLLLFLLSTFFPFVFGCRIQFAFRFFFLFSFSIFVFILFLHSNLLISYVQRTLQQQCRTRYFYLILLIACAVDAAVCEFYSSWLLFLFSIYVQFKSFLFLLFLISLLASTVAKAKMML